MKNNIIILSKLVKEPNLRIQSVSEELVKNEFESSLNNWKLMEKEEKEFERRFKNFPIININHNENKNLNDIKHFDEDIKISKNNIITKEKLWRWNQQIK